MDSSIHSGKYQQRYCYTGVINGVCYSFVYRTPVSFSSSVEKRTLTISADREICKIKYVNDCTGEFNVSGLKTTMKGKMVQGTCNEKM